MKTKNNNNLLLKISFVVMLAGLIFPFILQTSIVIALVTLIYLSTSSHLSNQERYLTFSVILLFILFFTPIIPLDLIANKFGRHAGPSIAIISTIIFLATTLTILLTNRFVKEDPH